MLNIKIFLNIKYPVSVHFPACLIIFLKIDLLEIESEEDLQMELARSVP